MHTWSNVNLTQCAMNFSIMVLFFLMLNVQGQNSYHWSLVNSYGACLWRDITTQQRESDSMCNWCILGKRVAHIWSTNLLLKQLKNWTYNNNERGGELVLDIYFYFILKNNNIHHSLIAIHTTQDFMWKPFWKKTKETFLNTFCRHQPTDYNIL